MAIECCCWTIACLVVIVSCGVTLVWLADCLTVFAFHHYRRGDKDYEGGRRDYI